jgi:hypothetical protein
MAKAGVCPPMSSLTPLLVRHNELCILAVCLPGEVICGVKGSISGYNSRSKGQGAERHEKSSSGMSGMDTLPWWQG